MYAFNQPDHHKKQHSVISTNNLVVCLWNLVYQYQLQVNFLPNSLKVQQEIAYYSAGMCKEIQAILK